MNTFACIGVGTIGSYISTMVYNSLPQGLLCFARRPAEVAEFDASSLGAVSRTMKVEEGKNYTTDYSRISECGLILLCTKCGATKEVIKSIAPYLQEGAVILSLQNGLTNTQTINQALEECQVTHKNIHVYATVVVFNVVSLSLGTFKETTSGPLVVDYAAKKHQLVCDFVNACQKNGVNALFEEDILGIQHAKLLINLANSVNALSGKPLLEMMLDRKYRRVVSKAIGEGLRVFKAAHKSIKVIKGGPRPVLARWATDKPDWLYFMVARKMLTLDKQAKLSMLIDIEKGRETEIDFINGYIADLGKEVKVPTPVNDVLISLVKAKRTNLSSEELLGLL